MIRCNKKLNKYSFINPGVISFVLRFLISVFFLDFSWLWVLLLTWVSFVSNRDGFPMAIRDAGRLSNEELQAHPYDWIDSINSCQNVHDIGFTSPSL